MVHPYSIEEYKAPKTGPLQVKREINLAKWPQLFATRRTTAKSRRITRGNEEVIVGLLTDNRNTESEVGILIVPDYITLLGLIYIWELYDKPNEKVTVQVRSFAERVLRRTPSQVTYEYLEKSLWRLNQIPITWINAFYDSKTGNKETLTTEGFTFLQYLKTTKVDYSGSNFSFKTFTFQFNDHFLENLLHQQTLPLALNEVVAFNREMSVLAYAFLDLIMAKKKHWSRYATAFLREDLQIAAERYKKPSRAREEVEKIAAELNGRAVSSGTLHTKVRKVRNRNEWKLVVEKEPAKQATPQQSGPADVQTSDPEVKDLVDQMSRILGNREQNAGFYRRIAQRCPRDLINTVLQDTLDEDKAGNIETTRAQFFGYWIQYMARKRGIDLGIKSSFNRYLDT